MQTTEKHRDKLLKRYSNDTFLKNAIDKSVRLDTIKNILDSFDKRVYNSITQEEVADYCKVSKQTIKRFENLEVDSLELYLNYTTLLSHLPNSKATKERRFIKARFGKYNLIKQ